jgi:hypothetical protein
VDTDILKPNTGYLSVERPSQIPSSKGSSEPPTSPGVITPEDERPTPYIEPVSEDEGDEEINVEPAKDEGKRTRLTGDEFAQAIAYREKMLKEREAAGPMPPTRRKNGNAARDQLEEETDERTPLLKAPSVFKTTKNTKPRTMSIDPLAPSSAFDQTLRERLRGAQDEQEDRYNSQDRSIGENGGSHDDNEHPASTGSTSAGKPGDDRELIRNWTAPPGKLVAVPVRVEPKVYFAAERTFLVSSYPFTGIRS